jgi:broad specificity phosphatase PhoE
MKVYLIRHGQTASNIEGRYVGHLESALTPFGLRQIQAARARLDRIPFKQVYCSPSLRTRQTAAALGIEDYAMDERLKEIHFGIFEGLNYEEMMKKHPRETRDFYENFEGYRIPGGESLEDLTARVADFLEHLREGPALLITHGGWMMALLKWLHSEEKSFWDYRVSNGEILVLEKGKSGWRWLKERGGGANGK